MKKTKILVDREPLSSDYIESRQNFGHVLSQMKNLKPPVWKSAWFYGPIGLAVVTIALTFSNLKSEDSEDTPTAARNTQANTINTLMNESNFVSDLAVNATTETNSFVNEGDEGSQSNPSNHSETSSSNVGGPEMVRDEPVQEEIILEEVTTEESKKLNQFPHFDNHFFGEIPVAKLCSEKGLQINDEVKIRSYKIQFFNGKGDESRTVVGESIPEEICELIREYNMGSMVFITDIIGESKNGETAHFASTNFTPHF